GLGYDSVREANPGLVYCSVTGFGSGAGAGLPGYDLLVQAMGGLMSVTGPEPGAPTKAGVALVDVLTGLHATVGILGALQHRSRTGAGQRVEVNLLSALLSSMVNQSTTYAATGQVPGIMGHRHPSLTPYETDSAADGPIVLAVGNDAQFAALCQGLGVAALAADARFATNPARVAHRGELTATLAPRLAERPAAEWFEVLTPLGVPSGPVNDLSQAFELADRLGLAPRVDVGGVGLVANPLTYSATPVGYRRPPPGLGQHTAEVEAWLGDG
ncbi:MAG: CaiB/BaiF CoA transferase family protein, partial [Acidimicrobiales bacterium]